MEKQQWCGCIIDAKVAPWFHCCSFRQRSSRDLNLYATSCHDPGPHHKGRDCHVSCQVFVWVFVFCSHSKALFIPCDSPATNVTFCPQQERVGTGTLCNGPCKQLFFSSCWGRVGQISSTTNSYCCTALIHKEDIVCQLGVI
jgi:hypothetical protein